MKFKPARATHTPFSRNPFSAAVAWSLAGIRLCLLTVLGLGCLLASPCAQASDTQGLGDYIARVGPLLDEGRRLQTAARELVRCLHEEGWVDTTSPLATALGSLHLPPERSEADNLAGDARLLQACKVYEQAARDHHLKQLVRELERLGQGEFGEPLKASQLHALAEGWHYTRFDGLQELPPRTLVDALLRDSFNLQEDALVKDVIVVLRRNCQHENH